MLARLRELAGARATFAFETTLSTRSCAPWIARLRSGGYRCCLVFLYLPSPDVAVERVQNRVKEGGHAVPEGLTCRRYRRGLANLFTLYLALADDWAETCSRVRLRGVDSWGGLMGGSRQARTSL